VKEKRTNRQLVVFGRRVRVGPSWGGKQTKAQRQRGPTDKRYIKAEQCNKTIFCHVGERMKEKKSKRKNKLMCDGSRSSAHLSWLLPHRLGFFHSPSSHTLTYTANLTLPSRHTVTHSNTRHLYHLYFFQRYRYVLQVGSTESVTPVAEVLIPSLAVCVLCGPCSMEAEPHCNANMGKKQEETKPHHKFTT
jgi:hypothetical protein